MTQRIANADISANGLSKVDNSAYNITKAIETGATPAAQDFSNIVDAALEHNVHLNTLADSARVKAASAATRSERAAWQREAKYLEKRVKNNDAVIDRLKGVDSINKKSLAASHIYKLILGGNVSNVRCLTLADVEIVEFVAGEKSAIVKTPIKDIRLPENVNIGGIIRDGVGFVAMGTSHIQPGDNVLVFCAEDTIRKVEKLFK